SDFLGNTFLVVEHFKYEATISNLQHYVVIKNHKIYILSDTYCFINQSQQHSRYTAGKIVKLPATQLYISLNCCRLGNNNNYKDNKKQITKLIKSKRKCDILRPEIS